MDEFKERQREMWAAGDYATLAEHIADVGEHVVARTGIEAGMRVLDVACGTGNAALPAARAGAHVVGLDFTPELLDAGRAKADTAGVEIEWVEGDAESIPFGEAAFDRVYSTFGHMFAPRHRQTADELVRVCRKEGVIGLCSWTADGTAGDVFRAAAAYLPPPPEYASPPILWGDEDYVREIFGPVTEDIELERRVTTIEWDSVESFGDYFMDRFGPLVTAKAMLGDRFSELRADLLGIWADRNEADDGTLRLPQEYLVSLMRF